MGGPRSRRRCCCCRRVRDDGCGGGEGAEPEAYGTYWNRLVERWGYRRIDEPTASQIRALAEALREVVVVRRNSRGDNGAVENFVSAVRCIYRHAVADGFINAAENPATNIDKPRSTRSPRAPATTRSWTR